MRVCNRQPEEESKKPPQTTKEQTELLRTKIEIEDDLKNSPDSALTKQFYDQMTRPFRQPNKTDKEPDKPP